MKLPKLFGCPLELPARLTSSALVRRRCLCIGCHSPPVPTAPWMLGQGSLTQEPPAGCGCGCCRSPQVAAGGPCATAHLRRGPELQGLSRRVSWLEEGLGQKPASLRAVPSATPSTAYASLSPLVLGQLGEFDRALNHVPKAHGRIRDLADSGNNGLCFVASVPRVWLPSVELHGEALLVAHSVRLLPASISVGPSTVMKDADRTSFDTVSDLPNVCLFASTYQSVIVCGFYFLPPSSHCLVPPGSPSGRSSYPLPRCLHPSGTLQIKRGFEKRNSSITCSSSCLFQVHTGQGTNRQTLDGLPRADLVPCSE